MHALSVGQRGETADIRIMAYLHIKTKKYVRKPEGGYKSQNFYHSSDGRDIDIELEIDGWKRSIISVNPPLLAHSGE